MYLYYRSGCFLSVTGVHGSVMRCAHRPCFAGHALLSALLAALLSGDVDVDTDVDGGGHVNVDGCFFE